MRLGKLTLQNFKGIEKLTISPNGANLEIFGENGTGKTTIADAYAWVVFGKSFTGDSIEPEIKRRDPATGLTPNDGGIVHAVEVELQIEPDRVLTLRKEYSEKWEKKRGAAESQFRGHTTNYFIDGTPLPKKEYDKRMAELIPEEAGRLLSIPLYFCRNLKWQERRKILMAICGEVSDADLLAKEEFSPLQQLMAGKSIDDYRKTVKVQMKKVNEELKAIPERIDELAHVGSTAVGNSTKESITEKLSLLQKNLRAVDAKISRLENGGETAEMKKELAKIEAAITTFRASSEAEHTRIKSEAESSLRKCVAELERVNQDAERSEKHISQLETINAETDKQTQELREEWGREYAKELDVQVSDTCPCCGQKLPAEKLKEAEEKAFADFNRKKAETLEEITAKGKRMMEQREKDVKKIELERERLSTFSEKTKELEIRKKEAEQLIESESKFDLSETEEYQRMEAERNRIVETINKLVDGDASEELEKAREEVYGINADIAAENEKLAAIAQAESLEKRRAELMEREKELGEMFGNLEKSLDLTEKLIKSKVRLIEDNINSRFQFVHFTMFREQINGGLEECCEPTINGVPFGEGLNTGSEMKAALDILNVLSNYFGLDLPVIIDNCESYTSDSLIPIKNQLIRLNVREGQKTLAVEIEGQEQQEITAVSRKVA